MYKITKLLTLSSLLAFSFILVGFGNTSSFAKAPGAWIIEVDEERCADPRVAQANREGELLVVASIYETPETTKAHSEGFKKYWCLDDDFEVKFEIRNNISDVATAKMKSEIHLALLRDWKLRLAKGFQYQVM